MGGSLFLCRGEVRIHAYYAREGRIRETHYRNDISRCSNQFSISTREITPISRAIISRSSSSRDESVMVLRREFFATERNYYNAFYTRSFGERDARDFSMFLFARDSYLAFISLKKKNILWRFIEREKMRRRISDIIGMHRRRSRSGFRDSLSKGGFTVFLEALFRPGGTDLAVASVLLVCARTDHKHIVQRQWQKKKRGRKREKSKRELLVYRSD